MQTIPNYPDIRPSLLLDFANSRRVDPRVTFTRSSTATYHDAKGVLQTAPVNTPRIDYDPVTGECKGLLIEESRSNFILHSENLGNAAWAKQGVTVAAMSTAPNSELAYKIVEDTSSGLHRISTTSSSPTTSGTTYTASVYAKQAGRRYLYLNSTAGINAGAVFDLESASVVGVIAGTATISHTGNGWLRCTVTGTATVVLNPFLYVEVKNTSSGGSTIHQGDGYSGIYIWGAQIEAGAFPTSYIPTTTSQVTRVADLPILYGAPIAQSAGTFLAEASSFGANNTDRRILAASSGSTANYVGLHFGTTGDNTSVVQSGGVFQYGPAEGAALLGQRYQRAIAYEAGNMRAATGGVLSNASPSSVLAPSAPIDRLDIGHRLGAQFLNGHIARITYYPKRLPDATLQALTA